MLDLCVNPPAAISFFPLSLHDALPISPPSPGYGVQKDCFPRAHLTVFRTACEKIGTFVPPRRTGPFSARADGRTQDRKSTRLNSSHVANSYAVLALKKNIPKLPNNDHR